MGGQIRKLAGQTMVYGLSSIVGRVLNFLLVPLYVRTFTEGEYGIYTNIYAYFTFLNILYTYGMETAYFRFVSREDDPEKVFSTVTLSLAASTALFSLALFLGRDALCSVMGYRGHPEYIIWMMSILALDTLAVTSFAALRHRQRPAAFALIRIAGILINVGFNLFFLVLCPRLLGSDRFTALHPLIDAVYSPATGIGYIFISNIIASAVTLLLLSGELSRIRLALDLGLIRRMLAYASPLVVVGFAGMINDNLDRTLLKHLLPHDPAENDILLGIYGANAKLAVFMVLITQAFKYAAEPFFFLQAAKDDAKKTYADVMLYFVIFGLLLFLFVDMNLDLFKYLVGREGSRYHEGLFIVPILLMANLFLGIYYNLSIWYKLSDQTLQGALIALAGAAVTLVFNLALVPRFGYGAAAWTKLACYIVMVALSYEVGRRIFPVAYSLKRLGIYFLVALFIHGLFTRVHGGAVFRLVVGNFLISAFVVFVLIYEKIPLRRLIRLGR
ncbi:oligosaccharide flippase family protein [Desulfatiferula olefinivorans]